jgi:hypothetical protein
MIRHQGGPVWQRSWLPTASALGCAQREAQRVVDTRGLGPDHGCIRVADPRVGKRPVWGPMVAGSRYGELLEAHPLELRFSTRVNGLVIAMWITTRGRRGSSNLAREYSEG